MKKKQYKNYKAFTLRASFDFKFAALFLCMICFFANLSIKETTVGSVFAASDLSFNSRNFLIAVRMLFA